MSPSIKRARSRESRCLRHTREPWAWCSTCQRTPSALVLISILIGTPQLTFDVPQHLLRHVLPTSHAHDRRSAHCPRSGVVLCVGACSSVLGRSPGSGVIVTPASLLIVVRWFQPRRCHPTRSRPAPTLVPLDLPLAPVPRLELPPQLPRLRALPQSPPQPPRPWASLLKPPPATWREGRNTNHAEDRSTDHATGRGRARAATPWPMLVRRRATRPARGATPWPSPPPSSSPLAPLVIGRASPRSRHPRPWARQL